MTGLILRVGYNKINDHDIDCIRLACCFVLTDIFIATPYHAFHMQRDNFRFTEYFVFIDNEVINFMKEDLLEFPEADITLIKLKNPHGFEIPELSSDLIKKGTIIHSQGLSVSNKFIYAHIDWKDKKLVVKSYGLSNGHKFKQGCVTELKVITSYFKEIGELQIKKAKCFHLSYGGEMNESMGSPVFNTKTKELTGMILSGDGRQSLNGKEAEFFWALSSLEIIKRLKQIGIVKKQWWEFF